MRFDDSRPIYKRIGANVTRRSLRTKSYTGDQGIFTRRSIFEQLNGHRDWPFMEDVDYSERMNKLGPSFCSPTKSKLPLAAIVPGACCELNLP